VESDLVLRRDLDSTLIRLGGTLPQGAPAVDLHVAVPDPARYATTVLAEVLAARGIEVAGGVATTSDPVPAGGRILARHEGWSMAEMIAVANKESQNLHAEMLLRLAAAKQTGTGTVEGGVAAEQALARRLGIALGTGAVADGSGLSPSNLVKPRDVVALLVAMAHHPQAAAFRDSLAVAGVDGTLRHRFQGTPIQGRVRAKTGTVHHVNALAGYAVGPGGREIAFAIVANHQGAPAATVVRAIDAAVGLIVDGRWR
jgi:D-alanyl-D-alanine carboxypeptidase/D-alanyl-D-alanine-endopeptidase (penicillin-binding protein 4)